MKPTYRVRDWEKHFENHESRKVKRSYWVAIPNRHDGKSYRRIAAHSEGVQIFAAWILILEAASKMPERGVLADEDGPLDAEDLSAMTGFPAAIFESAFNLLTQDRIGWLAVEEAKPRKRKSPATSRNLPDPPAVPGNAAVELQGTTGNGTEGKDREQHSANAGASADSGKRQEDFDIWTLGVGKLMATGTSEQDARSFLGKQRKEFGGDVVSEAITKLLAQNPVDPKAYLIGVLQGRAGPRTQKSKVDHSMDAVKRVLAEKEAERNGTSERTR